MNYPKVIKENAGKPNYVMSQETKSFAYLYSHDLWMYWFLSTTLSRLSFIHNDTSNHNLKVFISKELIRSKYCVSWKSRYASFYIKIVVYETFDIIHCNIKSGILVA